MTGAITVALRERLEREKKERDAETLVQDLEDIAHRCAATLRDGPSAIEQGGQICVLHTPAYS